MPWGYKGPCVWGIRGPCVWGLGDFVPWVSRDPMSGDWGPCVLGLGSRGSYVRESSRPCARV